LLKAFVDVLQPPLNFSALAPDEQVDAVMLGVQDAQEGVAEDPLGGSALAGYGNGFVGARGCLVLDEVFEVIIVNVVYGRKELARG
jgi:hypothetical protein